MEQPKNNLKIIADKKNARVILPNMLTLIGVCICLLYTSPSPRDRTRSRMPSSA